MSQTSMRPVTELPPGTWPSSDLPPPPPGPPPPAPWNRRQGWALVVFALCALVMTLPVWIWGWSVPAADLFSKTNPVALFCYRLALPLGLTSFVLALVSRHRARQRRSSARRRANLALAVALVGAAVWAIPFMGVLNEGL
jgi:ferric-dicitrate binding protein FerR (iron transport regulator)